MLYGRFDPDADPLQRNKIVCVGRIDKILSNSLLSASKLNRSIVKKFFIVSKLKLISRKVKNKIVCDKLLK